MACHVVPLVIGLLAFGAGSERVSDGTLELDVQDTSSKQHAIHGISNECGTLADLYSNVFGEEALKEGPQRVGGFTLKKCLGAGGMGEVWMAETDDNKPVALKVATIPPAQLEMATTMGKDNSAVYQDECKFAQEAELHVKHPAQAGIAACLAFGVEEVTYDNDGEEKQITLPYMASELVTGTELERLLKQDPEGASGPLESLKGVFTVLENLQTIMTDLADPVDHVKLYHADLQPSNILISDEGKLTVLDYGFNTMCCEAEVPLKDSCFHEGKSYCQSCNLEREIQLASKTMQPCVGQWAEPTTKRQAGIMQRNFVVQNFVGMLINFPKDETRDDGSLLFGGLSVWWYQKMKESPEFEYVKENLRAAYRTGWTDQCDNAVHQAVNEECDLQCLFAALEAARASVQ